MEDTKRGQDETLQEVISQLKAQHLQDTARINKVGIMQHSDIVGKITLSNF